MRHVSLPPRRITHYRFSGTAKRHQPSRSGALLNHANNPQRYATTLKTQAAVSTLPSITCPTGSARLHTWRTHRQCLSAVRASVPDGQASLPKAIGTRVSNILGVSVEDDFLCASSSSAIFSSTRFFSRLEVALIYTRLASRQCPFVPASAAP